MTRLRLSKHELTRQQERLRLYRRLLPSLDLKRRQLSAAVRKAEVEHDAIRQERTALLRRIGEELPMLAHPDLALHGLVELQGYQTGERNIVGVRVPVLEGVECRVADYSRLGTPPWIDVLVERLRQAIELQLRLDFAGRRLDILRRRLRKVTQRVNLFEKVLIPETEANIKRLRIHLDELDRAAIIVSKLAKRKQRVRRGVAT